MPSHSTAAKMSWPVISVVSAKKTHTLKVDKKKPPDLLGGFLLSTMRDGYCLVRSFFDRLSFKPEEQ
jgi:hypothetical protein